MELNPADFTLIVIFGSCLLVVAATVISRTLHARAESRSLARRVICRLCLHAFENHGHSREVKCPSCGTANEKGRPRRLG
jgi:ribosomal protein S27E